MNWLPSGHGYTHLLAVLPHAFGVHRDAWAWWDVDPRNGITAFATVALFEDPNQTRRQSTGVWAMETVHMVTEFGDLYNGSPSTGRTTLWPTPALRVTRAPIRSLRWAGSRPQTSLAINPGPDLRPARHRSPAATSTRPSYRGQGPGRSSRSTVGGRSVRTQGRLRRRHHRLRRLSARSARLGCPWAHRQPAKVVPCRRYTFWYTSLPTSRARTGTKPLVTVPPLTDSGMPVVHARRRRSGAVGPVARLPAATIRMVSTSLAGAPTPLIMSKQGR
jgi:hypothetical protein